MGADRTRRGGVCSWQVPELWPGTGGPPTRYEPTGELQPILLDGLNQPVVAVWSSAEGDQRWYIVPDVCDWDSILDWLGSAPWRDMSRALCAARARRWHST